MAISKFTSKASLHNALDEIPNLRRIGVDAGCRTLSVYWIEGEYVRPSKLRERIPEIIALRDAGMTIKEALRHLKIETSEDATQKAITRYRGKT